MTTDQGTALARVEEVDRQDESQIMRHMSGELVTEYVYKFTDGGGREQKGLSWAGTRELAQLLGSIEVEADPQIEMRDEEDGKGPYWRVMCRATDKRRNVTVLGGVHEYVWKPKRNGGRYENQHAFTVALSKAQRNAIKNLVPVSIVHTLIEDMEQLADGQITVGEARRAVDVKTGVIEEKAAPPARASASVVVEEEETTAAEVDDARHNMEAMRNLSQFWAKAATLGVGVEEVGALLGEKPTTDSFKSYMEREGLSGLGAVLERLKDAKG